jgi:hypothetical protein
MPEPVRLSFVGEFDPDLFRLEIPQSQIIADLQKDSARLAAEISKRIQASIGIGASQPSVTIHFTEGSIHWSGIVQWAHDAWPIVGILSNIAGAIAFVQIVRNSIDGVLRRRFRAFGIPAFWFFVPTEVYIVSGPVPGATGQSSSFQILLGIAAMIASTAALLAAVGFFIREVFR